MEARGGPAPRATRVEFEGVSRRYGDFYAVRGVSLAVEPGEFFSLLGPSGSGKTTLLRMVAGFGRPDEGRILFDGEPVDHVPPWERNVGMVFQSYALWPHMTVFQNIAFGLRERRLPAREVRERAEAALEMVELKGFGGRRPSQLSGGQQQRVALARTIVVQPRVLLLDEPLSNLDAKLRIQMRAELVRLQRRLGITTIYVTHDQEEALTLSTRVAVMSGGRVLQVGAPREVYDSPGSPFVADFVGRSNLLPARVVGAGAGGMEALTPGGHLLLAALPPVTAAEVGREVVLSIRPEAIALADAREGGGEGTNRLRGVVRAVEFLGAREHYEVELAGGLRLRANAPHAPQAGPFPEGREVVLRVAPEDIALVRDAREPGG